MNTRRPVFCLLTSLCLLSARLPSVAFAGPPEPAPDSATEAAKLKSSGDEAMVNSNFQEALEKYQGAYAMTKSPALLYNQGRALQSLNRLPEALDMLIAFERDAPADLKAKVPKLAELKADLESRVAKLVVDVNEPGATIKLGDRVLGTSPLAELRVNAGDAKIEVSKEGFGTERRSVKLDSKRAVELKIDLISKDRSGVLVVTSKVKGAHVEVDGKPVGDVPSEVRLLAGSHKVTFQARGYDDNTVEVVLLAGQTKPLELQPGSAPAYKQGWFWGTVVGVLATGGLAGGLAAGLVEKGHSKGTIQPGVVPVSFVLLTPPIHF